MSDPISRQQAIDAMPSAQPTHTTHSNTLDALDCISRQAAIDAMAKAMPQLTTPDGSGQFDHEIQIADEAFVDAMQIIHDLPSAQPEQKWIPCSERMPEKDDRYQVTRYDYVTNTEFIDILWYEKNTWWNRQATGNYAVTAWMPLPEPYTEVNNGN